ncbi:polysaccharide biosynthesis/export family protein [Lutimonas zeaxanthinifaciens]|uniref:polysaccharide biosynthesis/export family protein n=1 Tax=Lutimonas zeaxanthinifaciens TaxID=3060215 RepID=UPI00265D0321|nr:polysaccharide biosynthesis/export family protein [Lutimonas sp. YSD2104]WKK67198.1 polysaccharide biosynthesis/export family protein [Lutimonas sp. YSD2104]
MRKILAILLLFAMFTSCIPLKDQIYFQGDLVENDSIKRIQDEPYRLQVNDILDIQIKSSDAELVALFSSTPSGNNNGTNSFGEQNLYFKGYTVDRHGNIRLPYLGDINVLGYTTREVLTKLEKEFQVYFKNPDDVFINVKLAGIRFTVIGEVGNTGTRVLYMNQVNLVQALAAAGDIEITGNRKNVKIFRKSLEGTKQFDVNMLDINSFDDDNFFIKSNDIIYVEPLKQKAWGTGTSGMQTITSLIAVLSLVTTTILLVNTL